MRRKVFSAAILCAVLSASPLYATVITTSDLVSVNSTGPGTFDFSVGGWDGGGTVTGSFAGIDSDVNGQLSSFAGEISAFTMSYSGGTVIGPLTLGFGDLFGLVYDLDGGPLGDGLALDIEGIGAIGAGGSPTFLIGPGPVNVCGTGQVCGIIDSSGQPVPEPGTFVLLVSGLAVAARRRQRKA